MAADVHATIRFAETATVNGCSWEIIFLMHLADRLERAYVRTNEMVDLEEAVVVWERAPGREDPSLAEQYDHLRQSLDSHALPDDSLMNQDRERGLPGFEDFLGVPTEAGICAAAEPGPIVVINVSRFRCDAILMEKHQTRLLALPQLTEEDINKGSWKESGRGSLKILAWLWDTIADLVLSALGFTQPPADDDSPHVWWMPTCSLSGLSPHNAGRHSDGSIDTVLDRVVSSYSSSVEAIIRGRARDRGPPTKLSPSPQALLVAMETTPGEGSELSFAEREVTILDKICTAMNIDLVKPERRKSDILRHLARCDIFYFAGHGYTGTNDPLRSHLRLDDWETDPLTIASLLEINLRKTTPFLAYLSACGTAQIRDARFVDESIHLVSTCELAGFRHVIGTVWEVNDELCTDVARITYEVMASSGGGGGGGGGGGIGLKHESVGRALHKAVRCMRDD